MKAIFILFAAMNAFGYDDENDPRGMSKERRVVCRALLRRDLHTRYATLARHIKKQHPWRLIRAVLRARSRNPLVSGLQKFAKEQKVEKLWHALRTLLAKRNQTLTPVFKHETERLITFLEKEPRAIKRVMLILNPLDAHWRGYSFVLKNVGYVVAGPGTTQETTRLIRHELLHFLASRFAIPNRFTALNEHRHKENEGYDNRAIIAREYVIRGLNLLYEYKVLHKNISSALRHEEKQFPHIRAVLKLFEK